MNLPVFLRPEAEDDIRSIHNEYELVRTGLGDQFVKRAQETLERIEAMPNMYGIIWEDVRAVRLKKFRHVLYYVVFEDRVEVIAVMHGSRDASGWQSRK